jgi:ribosomal protein S27AE
MNKTCTRCGESKPGTRDFVGSTPNGGLRGYCRACMNQASRNYEADNKTAGNNKTLAEHWDWRVTCGLDVENLGRKYGIL